MEDTDVSLRGKVEVKNQVEAEILSKRSGNYSSHRCDWGRFSVSRLVVVANENWSDRYKV